MKEAIKINTLRLDELVGAVETHELNVSHNKRGRKKTVAFQGISGETTSQNTIVVSSGAEGERDLSKSLSLLAKNFGKFMKTNGYQISVKKKKGQQTYTKKERGIQCHECEGYGHIQS